MLCKCHWIVIYTVHFIAFCLRGPFFPGHGVERWLIVVPTRYTRSATDSLSDLNFLKVPNNENWGLTQDCVEV